MHTPSIPPSLGSKLSHQPQELQFGTSGRRGKVIHLTQLEIYLNAVAELEFLQSLPVSEGGIVRGDEFFYGFDLRPSSTRYVAEFMGRGEIAQTIVRAIRDCGMKPVNLGQIPTPAVACHAFSLAKGSIMVTGSHIPFDSNGYKTNTSKGELLKIHELPIHAQVREVRERLYAQAFADSLFDEEGRFKSGHQDLTPVNPVAAEAYVNRYVDFFGNSALAGLRLAVYQHSAVGRDLLVDLLGRLDAEVFATGRSEAFIPIDTENLDAEKLATLQALHDETAAKVGRIDAVISTDGDSDRPLILGVDSGQVHFFGGDLVGMVTAEFMGADAVVVPINCNDALDLGVLKHLTEPKTKIGSPHVIAGMAKAIAKGKRAVCGFEANGGFLTGSAFVRNGKTLAALPTRDAMLPIIATLCATKENGGSLSQLFAGLPRRFSKAALLKAFPRSLGQLIVQRFSPADASVVEVLFKPDGIVLLDEFNHELTGLDGVKQSIAAALEELTEFFSPALGYGKIVRLNTLDGLRIYFDNGEVAHVRPSGNADELRTYAVADTQARANDMVKLAVAEPDGILRRLERQVNVAP